MPSMDGELSEVFEVFVVFVVHFFDPAKQLRPHN